eukprot:3920850-Amphidinium_carterae.1
MSVLLESLGPAQMQRSRATSATLRPTRGEGVAVRQCSPSVRVVSAASSSRIVRQQSSALGVPHEPRQASPEHHRLDSESRLEDRVSKLHRSLESMIQESVSALAQSLRAEWKQLLAEEQKKFDSRIVDIGHALMKEAQSTIRDELVEEVRSQTKAAFKHEMRGLVACFAFGSADQAFEHDEQFKELRAGVTRLEHRLDERSLCSKSELSQRITQLEAVAGASTTASSLTEVTFSNRHCEHSELDVSAQTQKLDIADGDDMVALGSKASCVSCATVPPANGCEQPHLPPLAQAMQRMEVMHSNMQGELAIQRSLIEALATSMGNVRLGHRAASSSGDQKNDASKFTSTRLG